MKIHVYQHVPFEGPGTIADWAASRKHRISISRWYEQQEAQENADADAEWLVVMGGPMGVHDQSEHPWLTVEKRHIEAAIRSGKTVLGICLGAQLVAEVLGAAVYRNGQREIGWWPLQRDPGIEASRLSGFLPERMEVFHWHGDTFSLPDGSVPVGSSEACACQGFICEDRIVALQFHLEITPAAVDALVDHCGEEIGPYRWVQTPDEMRSRPERFAAVNEVMDTLLNLLEGETRLRRSAEPAEGAAGKESHAG